MGRRGSELHFETTVVEEMSRSSDLNPSRTGKMQPEIEKMQFFGANSWIFCIAPVLGHINFRFSHACSQPAW